jgi:acyl-CoA synthetase (AMP-forming)/AMP-acid ligase II
MIYRSPHPDIALPDESFTDFIFASADAFADKPALVEGPTGRTIRYGELTDAIRRAAAGLQRRGLRKGDVVLLYAPNVPEYAVALHAILAAGGVVTTANALSSPEELARQLAITTARYAVTTPALVDNVRVALKGQAVRELFVLGEAPGATPFAELTTSGAAPAPPIEIDGDDLAVLLFSSGTTGLPKGVMLTHRILATNVLQTQAVEQMTADDVMPAVLPFFHAYGLVVVLGVALRVGATLITIPRFELEDFLRTLERYRVTRAHLVPPIVLALAKHPMVDRFDLSSLRWILSGAAPLGVALARACTERLGCVLRQGYGMTESGPVTHISPRTVPNPKPASVGQCVPNTECMIVDQATGHTVGPHQEGEVWVRGPQIMKGYLDEPEATAQAITADGWLRTGDIGYADDDGYLYIVDRVKEMIKCKAFQVAPAELEAVLLTHPAIADAAVIGIPDDEAGEVPKAFVVARSAISADEVCAHVAAHVAPYKKLRAVEFRESIPKSPSGKILRRLLIAEERSAAASRATAPAGTRV